jgi:two-component system response regulator PilR (NtrC family)
MRLPDGNGIDLIEFIQSQRPSAAAGCHDHRPRQRRQRNPRAQGRRLRFHQQTGRAGEAAQPGERALELGEVSGHVAGASRDELIGDTAAMQRLRQQIDKLARSQAPVHIRGESGSGKEVVARSIHGRGPRAAGPFVAVNCGAIPAELIESELFGHLKGSFTGASRDKLGLFQAAEGGTLFLDEVADLPLPMQVKLLRAIQEKRVRPVGANEEVPRTCACSRPRTNPWPGRSKPDAFARTCSSAST